MKREYAEIKLARGLIFHQNHILLVKNNLPDQGHYFLPGGKVDPGESVTHALVREFQEELNWHVHVGEFLGCYEHAWQHLKQKSNTLFDIIELNFLFTVKVDNELTLQDPPSMEEKISFHWVKLAELGKFKVLPKDFIEALPRLQRQIQDGKSQTFWGTSLKPEVSSH